MSTLTIRGCDDKLAGALQAEAKRRGISMNKFVLNLLFETLIAGKRNKKYDDLNHLAGTWTEEDDEEFKANTADFRKIDPEDWK